MNGMKMKKCYETTHSVVQLLLMLWMTSLVHIAAGDLFSCSGSNMNVSMTFVCDGYYDCDNYEDESSCNNSATYLEEGESNFISVPYATPRRLYNATILQTNVTNGFRVVFQYVYSGSNDGEVQIGTGNDPSDIQSVITTITGFINYTPDDVYVDTNEMWFAVIGPKRYPMREMDVEIISVDLSTLFDCSRSNMSVSPTVLCDGLYNCDHYEDELACNYSATYLKEGESHFLTTPQTTRTRLYNARILQTNATNGFRVVFRDFFFFIDDVFQVGTGNDPSDKHSVITTIQGYINYSPDDVYVDTNEMWFAVIGASGYSTLRMDVEIISIKLSTLFDCSRSNMSVSSTVLCDGLYNCDHYEDELACNYSATYLEEGESHFISLPYTRTSRFYYVTLLQTNATNGFRVVFQSLYLSNDIEVQVQIGTGNDPSDIQSVITTIHGYINYYPDDAYATNDTYVDTNEMWFAVIGGKGFSTLLMDVEIISSTLFACSSSNMSVPQTVLCDGRYHCDHYEDELACNNSATYLEEGESHFISLLYTTTRRLYNATLLQTNATNGFRVVFQDLLLYHDDKVKIGTGNDPSDIQSVITTIHGYRTQAPSDVYVDTNEMWCAVIGAKNISRLEMDVEIISIDLSIDCSGSNPCLNGGTCESDACTCAPGYTGAFCGNTINCSGSNPCQNGGNCDSNACTCAPGFTGSLCERGIADLCTQRNPCVNGDCRPIGQGQYACECQDHYEGIHCDEPTLPLEVSVHPSSQIVNINANVELICTFNYAKRYHWYRDDVLLPNSENQNPLIILSVAPSDIGYYFCRGSGRNGETLDTMAASVYVKDLTNIKVLNARFAIPFGNELYDKTSKLYRETAFNISSYVEQGLQTRTGLESVSVVCRALKPGSVKADMNIYIEQTNMTALKTQDLIGLSLESLANESNGFLDSNTISVQDNAICQNISWISPRFERVDFPVGENGTWANSTGMCPFNTTQAKEPIGRALCIGDGITQSQWQPVDNCGPFRNVTDILTEIAQVIVGEENADEVSQQVSSVTSNIEDITSDDIAFVAEITSNIVQQNLTSEEVTESLTSIASNIAQVETEELNAAEEEDGSISKFVQAFEEQISRVEVVDGGMLNIQQPNVAVQVQSVLADNIMSGLVLSLAGSSFSDLTKSNITIRAPTQDDHDDVIATRPDIIAQINIPSSVSSFISSTAPLSGSPSNVGGEYVRVNFNVFSSPALFISKSLRTISANNEDFNRSANSPVISLSIGQGKVSALSENINFTFTTLMSGYVNPMCSFWDEEEEDWSQDGCVLVSGFTSSDGRYDEERVRCACDHLTNFAVIMDIHKQEDLSIKAYNILTYIGCCISIFSLLVTLATYLWNKDLRTKQTDQIFICLCLTLLCLYTTFVIMISLDSTREYREVKSGPCGLLTALVHFFVLSSIAWMGVEGYNIYLIIVKIFNTYIQNFMIKASLAAWGIPALIVVLTGAIARGSYAHDDLCFLQFWAQIGGLLIPMSIILLINIVIFILVVRQLLWSANIAGRVKGEAKAERRETIERVQNAICILLLLGLTWVTGYLLLIPLFSQVAKPIFVVLNSFQGFFILLLYCVRKPHIRKKWGLTCFDKFLKKEASNSSGGVSSTTPSSSAGMISNLRPGASDNYLLPTKDDNPDPICMFNPTYDNSQFQEGVTPSMNKDLQNSIEEQKNDTDRNATGTDVVTVSLPLDASVTNATKRGDNISSTTDADTVSVTLGSIDVRNATEGTDDVASNNNDAAASFPKDAEDGTKHNERSNDVAL
ncbi:uncharacterized protein LOC100891145 isoform X1 [Strongylocentrotus purpuratus]|uniref:Uncharacterized protein n=1 Tax=Strongylocentrotus purpuratus TaxID=7668 RepID=A0A7M7T3V5_STRPU|nr:uncharacterized protein LOC100891145 isoform X1 [Strongylocentrotus purpuratus]